MAPDDDPGPVVATLLMSTIAGVLIIVILLFLVSLL